MNVAHSAQGAARRPRWLAGASAVRRAGESERLRSPQPLVRKRLPSGRGAMEQPNVTSDGAESSWTAC